MERGRKRDGKRKRIREGRKRDGKIEIEGERWKEEERYRER